jgi:hypothetical protein
MEEVRTEFGADRVELRERGEKSFVETAILIYILVAHGFVDEAGADLFRLWKATLLSALRRDDTARVAIHAPRTERSPEVLLVPPSSPELPEFVPIDFEGLIEQARELAPGNEIAKVVVAVTDHGVAYLDHAVDARGVTLTPAA